MDESMLPPAILLAGGFGTRLRSTVADRPKALAPVAGKPFLHYILVYLACHGIQQMILSLGYMADQVQEFVTEFSGSCDLYCPNIDLQIQCVVEDTPLGTGGALKLASSKIRLDQTFFAMNADTLFQIDLSSFWQQCTSVNYAHPIAATNAEAITALATIALRVVSQADDQKHRGQVRLNPDGRILAFDEKPITESVSDPAGAQMARQAKAVLTNGGVYLLSHEALESIPEGQYVSLEREVFPRLTAQGLLNGIICEGYFADIGTPESLATFEKDVLTGKVILA